MVERPGRLCLRALNQYRRRDVLAYLGLRYYFDNRASVRDRWARSAAVDLVLRRSARPYFKSSHFKEIDSDGRVKHRDIWLPGPNEAVAETALLARCAQAATAFAGGESVYSYRLSSPHSVAGTFEPYFDGFRNRHRRIGAACKDAKQGVVHYTDIAKFYPSITADTASRAWRAACDRARLENCWIELGDKILADHSAVDSDCNGLLTGPMFSHLIGNLVLRHVDERMRAIESVVYHRYVDDMVLVGPEARVDRARETLRKILEDTGLKLHDGKKDYRISVAEWLPAARDFEDSVDSKAWAGLVAGLRRALLRGPESQATMAQVFEQNEIRLPLVDHSTVAHEHSYLGRLKDLAGMPWFRRHHARQSPEVLLRAALGLRQRLVDDLRETLHKLRHLTGFERTRRLPRLRFCAGRLAYLGREADLAEFGAALSNVPDLRLHGALLSAIATKDVSTILGFGANAVQAVAQPLRALDVRVRCQPPKWTREERLGVAILSMNGVATDRVPPHGDVVSEIEKLAHWTGCGAELMRSEDPFIREVACLHGHDRDPRHGATLNSAFDRNEQLSYDVLTLLEVSDAS